MGALAAICRQLSIVSVEGEKCSLSACIKRRVSVNGKPFRAHVFTTSFMELQTLPFPAHRAQMILLRLSNVADDQF